MNKVNYTTKVSLLSPARATPSISRYSLSKHNISSKNVVTSFSLLSRHFPLPFYLLGHVVSFLGYFLAALFIFCMQREIRASIDKANNY